MSNSTQTETRVPAFKPWASDHTLPVPRSHIPVRHSTYPQAVAAVFGLALLVGMTASVLIQPLFPYCFLAQCLYGVLLGGALITFLRPDSIFDDLRQNCPSLDTNRSFLALMAVLYKLHDYDNDMDRFSAGVNQTRLTISADVREAWYTRGKGADVINGVKLADWYEWFEVCEDTLCRRIAIVRRRQGIFAWWARDTDILKLCELEEKLCWLGGEVLDRLQQRAETQRKLEEAAEWAEAKARQSAAAAAHAKAHTSTQPNQKDAQLSSQREAITEWLDAWEAKKCAQETATWAAAKAEAARNIAARNPSGELLPRGIEAQAKADAVKNLASKEAASVPKREAQDARLLAALSKGRPKLTASDKAAEAQTDVLEEERETMMRALGKKMNPEQNTAQRWAEYAEAEQKAAREEEAARLLAGKEDTEEIERDMEEYVCI